MARRKNASEKRDIQYWLSYSDMMAGLLLVFVLIISFTMMHAKHLYEEKEAELIEQQRIAVEQESIAEELQKQAEEQKKILDEQKVIMEQQQQKLDKILGIRSELIEALKDEFDGTDLRVMVDAQTGAITFDSNVLFDTGKYDIKASGQSFLKEFLPRYFSILMKPAFEDYISEIIIEGHTDTNGTYIYNLDLSQKRALSVATFCLQDNNAVISEDKLEGLRKMITANGKSFSNPVYFDNGEIDMASSRRVEFKFRLKDDEMIKEMIKILEENN